MNKPAAPIFCVFVSFCVMLGAGLDSTAQAEESMVDKADSMDFMGFHQEADKREAEKKAAQESSKHYSTNPAVLAANGEFFVVSERYSPILSGQTRYSAFSVTNVLHERMAQHCPDGFEIERQWSVPVEHDWLLHYGFTCLTRTPPTTTK